MYHLLDFRFKFIRCWHIALILPLVLLEMSLGQTGDAGTKKDAPIQFLRMFSADEDVNGNRTSCQHFRDVVRPSAAEKDITGESPAVCDKILDIVAGKNGAIANSAKPIAAAKVAVDSRLRVLITEPTTGTVHILDFANGRYSQIDTTRGDRMSFPYGIAVGADNSIYVTDLKRGRIAVYNAQGKFMRYVGEFKRESLFENPRSIAVDRATGRIYVADTTRNFIVILDHSGEILAQIGKRGGGNGSAEFKEPIEIAIYESEVFVLDRKNFRVQVLDLDGNFRRQFRFRDGAGIDADGMAIDSHGRLFIAFLSWVDAYNREGQFLFRFGQGGDQPGEFKTPNGISIDTKNRVYVLDSGNSRIQVFQVTDQAGAKTRGAR